MSSGSTIAITGASGFIGLHLLRRLKSSGFPVRAISGLRSDTPDLDAFLDDALQGVDTVIHASYPTSIPKGVPAEKFRQDMITVMHALTEACLRVGVRRFINLSTAEVYGDHGSPDISVSETDPLFAPTLYAQYRSETDSMLKYSAEFGLEYITLRLPPVYGPEPKPDFQKLLEKARRLRFLPITRTSNRRSILSVDNLSLVIESLIHQELWSVNVLNVADPGATSRVRVLLELAHAQGRPLPRMFLVPKAALNLAGRIGRRRHLRRELRGNIRLDTTRLALVCRDVSLTPTTTEFLAYYGKK